MDISKRLNIAKVVNRLSETRFFRWLSSGPTPSLAVLAVDMLVVALSCSLVFYYSEVPRYDHWWSNLITQAVVIVLLFGALSYAFKTNRAIIRMSAFEDIYRVVHVLVTLSVILLALRWLTCEVLDFPYPTKAWDLFVIVVFSFTMLLLIRLVIKYFFMYVSGGRRRKEPVMILSTNQNSSALGAALANEIGGDYVPVAYLTLVQQEKNHIAVGNIPYVAYSADTVEHVFKSHKCQTLIIQPQHMEIMRRELADVFLANNIKLLVANHLHEYRDGDSQQERSAQIRKVSIEDLLGRDPIKNENPNIRHSIQGQVVLITGAAGSIGSEIVRQVAKMGASKIVLVDQAETPMHEIQLEIQKDYPAVDTIFYIGDITNRQRMEQVFAKYAPRYVFHAAAYKHVPMMENNPTEAILTNVFGTKNLADLALQYRVEKFVMVSTDKAVNPTNIMGASKRIAEIYVQSLFNHNRMRADRPGTRFITTRFGNVLGSNGSVIPLFRKQIEEGGPVTVTHRDIIRYFMTIPEACSLVLEAGIMGHGGEIYIFDMGKPIKIYDLATRMISLSGLKPNKDINIIETGLRPGEKLYEELLNDKELTMATSHQKIMIAKVRQYNLPEVMSHLETLYKAAISSDVHGMVAEMKRIVPEYKSQNSKQFESIDREISAEIAEQGSMILNPCMPKPAHEVKEIG